MPRNLILDTCTLVWLVADDARLSDTAKQEGLSIVTGDRRFAAYGVEVVE